LNQKGITKYYISEKSKILKNFDKQLGMFRKILIPKLDTPKANSILLEMKEEYKTLLPEIIALKMQRNFLLREIKNISIALALVKVLKRYKYSRREIASFIFDLHKEYYQEAMKRKINFLRFIFTILSSFPFNKLYKFVIKRYEHLRQNREGSSNFIFKYIEGDDKTFDYGIDILSCPIYDMWQNHDAIEILPFVCLFDFFKSAITNSGLIRTMTLSEGKIKCDNRFRIGEKPQNKQKTKYFKN
jgi:hypothetical protein